MKLEKRDGLYHVIFTASGGEEVSLNLNCTNLEDAERTAKLAKIEELEQAAKIKALTADAMTMVVAGRMVTVQEALDEYVQWMGNQPLSQRTIEARKLEIQQFITTAKIGQKSVGSIDEETIGNFINEGGSTKFGTRGTKLSIIRSFMTFCSSRGWILGNPATLVRVDWRGLSHVQKEVKHKTLLTDEEIETVLAGLGKDDPFWTAAIVISRDCGLRISDICCLEWKSIDYRKHIITVHTQKTGTRVELPMTRRVIASLLRVPIATRTEKYVFPVERSDVRDTAKRSKFSVYFKRILAKHNITGKSFHSLRATFATDEYMSMQGVDQEAMKAVAEKLGHKGTKVTSHYVRTAATR